ncbi:Uncharacterised protein [Mycobacterium tuberculosis]|nr:Uncharacterised protein [Mycobacterium tuberculosis]
MLAASNTSVRNSTVPSMPVECSVSENTKSIRAVWVSIGIGVARASPRRSSPGVLLCQASIT